jgi:hypothetical protein
VSAPDTPPTPRRITEQEQPQFQRELRYIVIKISDAEAVLTKEGLRQLNMLGEMVAEGRRARGKNDLECVVVESDWPEYEPTWAAIQARCTESDQPNPPSVVSEERK